MIVERRIKSETFESANKVGFNTEYCTCGGYPECICEDRNVPQSFLQKWIRLNRGVHIEIYRNASGYYWGMCKSDGGTNLGWSEHCGPNDGGVWDEFEDALEHALFTQLSLELKQFGHWSNYAQEALKLIE